MPSLDTLLENFINGVSGPLLGLISIVAYLCAGLFSTIFLLRLYAHANDPIRTSAAGTAATFIVASLLFSFPQLSAATTATLFGSNTTVNTFNEIAYQPTSGATPAQATAALAAIFTFIHVIGELALLRAGILFRRVANGDSGANPDAPYIHFAGALLAINVVGVVKAVQTTIGITIIN